MLFSLQVFAWGVEWDLLVQGSTGQRSILVLSGVQEGHRSGYWLERRGPLSFALRNWLSGASYLKLEPAAANCGQLRSWPCRSCAVSEGLVVNRVLGTGSRGASAREGRACPFFLLHSPNSAGLGSGWCWEEGKSPKAVGVWKAAILRRGWEPGLKLCSGLVFPGGEPRTCGAAWASVSS